MLQSSKLIACYLAIVSFARHFYFDN